MNNSEVDWLDFQMSISENENDPVYGLFFGKRCKYCEHCKQYKNN